MLYLVSPTKTMKTDGRIKPNAIPILHAQSAHILKALRSLSCQDLCEQMRVKEKIAKQTYTQFQQVHFDLEGYCAIEAYDGLQFKYMQISQMKEAELRYLQEHLHILSGFYGVVKPFDSIYPYRLELQCKLAVNSYSDLYAFWNEQFAKILINECRQHKEAYMLNLASKEYAKSVAPYVPKEMLIDIVFQVEKRGVRKMEATSAKMARGRMIHFVATHNIQTLAEIKLFCEDGYRLDKERSSAQQLIFYKKVST